MSCLQTLAWFILAWFRNLEDSWADSVREAPLYWRAPRTTSGLREKGRWENRGVRASVCVRERFDYCLPPYPIQIDAVQAKQSTVAKPSDSAGRWGWTGVVNSARRASRLQFSLLNVNVPLCR